MIVNNVPDTVTIKVARIMSRIEIFSVRPPPSRVATIPKPIFPTKYPVSREIFDQKENVPSTSK